MIGAKLVSMLKNNLSADEIEDYLDSEEHENIAQSNNDEDDSWRGPLLLQSMLFQAKNLISSTLNYLDTYRDLLRAFLEDNVSQTV